jgi:glyoxylase-like metal-dependent hydrolase (beta-lactamase superfamily II)
MFLEVFSDNPFATNCWLLALEDREEAVVVDPGFEPDRLRRLLERAGKRSVAALATHGHVDHVGAAAALCGDEIPFYIHEADRLALEDPEGWGAGFPHDPIPVKDVRTVAEGDVLELAGLSIEVLHTPGHTPGSVCFRVGDLLLFSGDLVFAGSIGRSDFPNSSPQDMRRSLVRFLALPDPLPVLPGHGPRTTVERERRSNPFLLELV